MRGGEEKENVKLGFWQRLHVHGKRIEQPHRAYAGRKSRGDEKLRRRGTSEAKALKENAAEIPAKEKHKNATKTHSERYSDMVRYYRPIQEIKINIGKYWNGGGNILKI